MKFAVSIVVVNDSGNINHTAVTVEAENIDEAVGKGYRIARKVYANGFAQHHVVCSESIVLNPDDALKVFFST